MQKKIAIAVDESGYAAQAVRYAQNMAAVIAEAHYVLVNIQPAVSTYLEEAAQTNARARKELQRIAERNHAAAQALLERYRGQMVEAGLKAERVETATLPRRSGVAEDILALSQVASYDAVIVGRRGVSYLQEVVMGSVASNLMHHSPLTPIWIVDGDIGSGEIVLAVDGSVSSLRALDHLAFMLSGAGDRTIRMIHIEPRLQNYCSIDLESEGSVEAEAAVLDSDRKCIDDFYPQALAVIQKYGFSEKQIHIETKRGRFQIAKAILDTAREGDFGTVVVGKSGQGQSRFFGSVSRRIVQKAENLAVWVVP